MRFIELFAGIGGFRNGLEKANQSSQSSTEESRSTELEIQQGRKRTSIERGWHDLPDRHRELSSYRCVWANEWDKYASQIYRKNYPNDTLVEGDIRTVDPATIPEHDLITAGFPCQSFSIAGKRGGFEDTRGTLFFEIMRIAGAKRTPYLLLENVKGLLSHDEGDTFQTILRTLDEFGYDVQWQVLNSKDFGVPQNRERVFIIGHLRGQPRPKVFPIGEDGNSDYESDRQTTSYAIDSNYGKGLYTPGKGNTRTMIAQALQTDGQLRQGVSWGTDKPQSSRNIRRLTPIECERLQGFPDGWTEGISDTQRYKCLGNAVTTNVIEAIGRQWYE